MSAEQLKLAGTATTQARKPVQDKIERLTRKMLGEWQVSRLQRWGTLPFCRDCGLHIGTGVENGQRCGACAFLRSRAVLDVRLSCAEMRRFVLLVRKHWGDKDPRRLLQGEGGYRPTLMTTLHPRLSRQWTREEREQEVAACAEHAELADLYDRIQCSRGDTRRAVRS